MTSPLKRLQQWYACNCDGDWEHSYGIQIETIDNPGWMLTVDLERTSLCGRTCDSEDESSGGRWVSMRSDGKKLVAACDPSSLERVIESFIEFSGP
ncbi:immunity 53 family protein [Streptomyces sparsus]